MITFRYHLVSVAAVLLAMAAGVALGAGALDGRLAADRSSDSASGGDSALVSFEDGYAARTATGLIEGTLDDRSVVVLTLPGAREDEVAGVRRNLERAGATITGTVALTAKLLDPANRQFAESVATEAGPEGSGEGYARVGAALGRSLLGRPGRDLDETARTLASAFDEGALTSATDAPDTFAGQAVVVTGPSRAGDSAEVLAGLVRSIAGAGSGTLVAGPSAASREGGAIDVVRREASQVSTLDVTDSAAGRAVAALALARAAAGETGAWGTSRSDDGAVPR
jgi:hypothetical protein